MYQYPVPPADFSPGTLERFISVVIATTLFAVLVLYVLPRKVFIKIVKILFPFLDPPQD